MLRMLLAGGFGGSDIEARSPAIVAPICSTNRCIAQGQCHNFKFFPDVQDEAALLAGGASGFSRELHTVRRRCKYRLEGL